jgi:hypothetical protein
LTLVDSILQQFLSSIPVFIDVSPQSNDIGLSFKAFFLTSVIMDSAVAAETMNVLQLALEVDYWGWTKTVLFYFMLAICAAQTFYPILMIIAMWIRQMGFLAQYFHEVSHSYNNVKETSLSFFY